MRDTKPASTKRQRAVTQSNYLENTVMANILLIDDDEKLGSLLSDYFQQFELAVTHALSPSEAFKALDQSPFGLIVLDVMLPEMDGFDVCKKIRNTVSDYQSTPIIMLTARGEVTDRIVGLELGADDYLPKPFEPRELVARIHNILRRHSNPNNIATRPEKSNTNKRIRRLISTNIIVDLIKEQVQLDDHSIELTTMEFLLITLLMKNPNTAFSRDDIMNNLRGIDADLYSRAVDTLVSRLRHKLHDTQKVARFIKTVWGKGYSFIGEVDQC